MVDSTYLGRSTRSGKTTWPDGSSVSSSDVYRTALHTTSDVKSGTKNPHWRAKVRSIRQAGTPYSRSVTNNGFVSGNITGRYRLVGDPQKRVFDQKLSGQLFLDSGPGVPVNPSASHLDVQARMNFIKKCRKSQRQFQSGVFLGELREAIHMVTRPASALRQSISRYSSDVKRNIRAAKGPAKAKALSGTWLEYSFGWVPFLKDVDSAMEALATVNTLIPDVTSGFARDKWTTSRNIYNTSASGYNLEGTVSASTVADAFVRYLGTVAWESENRAPEWRSRWGITLSDFAPTVWELIPYSFLVDYFTNIGDVIDAASFGAVALRWGVKSSKIETKVQLGSQSCRFISASTDLPQSSISSSFSLSTLSRMSFSRSLVSSVDISLSDIQFKVPGVGDWRKWANMSALLVEKAL